MITWINGTPYKDDSSVGEELLNLLIDKCGYEFSKVHVNFEYDLNLVKDIVINNYAKVHTIQSVYKEYGKETALDFTKWMQRVFIQNVHTFRTRDTLDESIKTCEKFLKAVNRYRKDVKWLKDKIGFQNRVNIATNNMANHIISTKDKNEKFIEEFFPVRDKI